MKFTNESVIEKTYLYTAPKNPIPLLTSPLKGEEHNDHPSKGEEDNDFPPLQGEGKGGGGVNQMSIQL